MKITGSTIFSMLFIVVMVSNMETPVTTISEWKNTMPEDWAQSQWNGRDLKPGNYLTFGAKGTNKYLVLHHLGNHIQIYNGSNNMQRYMIKDLVPRWLDSDILPFHVHIIYVEKTITAFLEV
jgi:hypothetical protein